MAERNFDTDRKEQKYHKFTLGGKTFRVFSNMSISYLMKMDAPDETTQPLERTIDFLRSMIAAEDRPAFDELITSDEVFIEAQDLLDISTWIIEVISGRPTTSPGSSGNGTGRTSTGSKAKPSGQGGATGKK